MKNKFSILVLLEIGQNIKEAIFDLVKTINFLNTEIILLDNVGIGTYKLYEKVCMIVFL